MGKTIRRLIFSLLFILFIVFTILVDTIGTANDRGAAYQNQKAKNGKLLFQKYNCISCHQIYGLGGYMGPDLTNAMSQTGKGEVWCRALLAAGTDKMPDFKLSQQETDQLIAYLIYIDKTGISPVKKFDFNADGTVSIQP